MLNGRACFLLKAPNSGGTILYRIDLNYRPCGIFFLWLFSVKKTLMRNFKGLLTVSSHQSEPLSGRALLSICTSWPSIHFLLPHPLWPSTPLQSLVGAALGDGGQAFSVCQQLEPQGPEILRPSEACPWSPEAVSGLTVSSLCF